MAKEKRLIDAEALKLAIRDDPYINGSHYAAMKKHINDCPTVDAVEVVRCKDCTQYNGHRYCRYTELIVFDNDFCSYGERKDNG